MGIYKDTLVLVDKVSKPMEEVNKKIQAVDKRLDRLKDKFKSLDKFGNDMKSFGNKMTLGVTLPIAGIGVAALKAAADMEAAEIQLSTMLGSAEKGAKMFDDIKKMASKTPFGTDDLMSATNTMLGFGIAQEKVLPTMRMLGDIAGGNKQKFQSLTLAFSQISSAGKLSGQDLLQMINAGFNPLETIARKTGKSIGYWKDQMSKGNVSAEMVAEAMKDATSEGGRFYKMMEKQSQTGLGQLSTLMDNLNMALADFGKIMLPIAIKAIGKLSELAQWFVNLSPAAKKTIIVLLAMAAAIGPLVSLFGSLIVAIANAPAALVALTTFGTKLGGVLNLLRLGVLSLGKALLTLVANPVGVTIMAIAGLITLVVLLIKNWDKVKAAVASFANTAVQKFQELWAKLKPIFEKIAQGIQFAFNMTPLGMGIKAAKAIAGAVQNRQNNTQNNNSYSTTNNNYYGNTYNGGKYAGIPGMAYAGGVTF